MSCHRREYQVVNVVINASWTNTCQNLVEIERVHEAPGASQVWTDG